MVQTTGSPQPTRTDAPVVSRRATTSARRGRPRLRIDRAAFALAIGLAAALAGVTTADLNGFEIAGVSAAPAGSTNLGVGSAPSTADPSGAAGSAGDPTTDPPTADPPTADLERDWAATDHDGRVRFETERTVSLGTVALDLLPYDWEHALPEWRLDFIEGNDRVAGYTWSQEQRIEVFVRPDATGADVARILAHELGHAVDVTLNTGDERAAWLAQRGAAEGTAWWPSSGAADFETGAGDFAECFAVWQIGPADYRSVVAPVPSEDDLAMIARLAE